MARHILSIHGGEATDCDGDRNEPALDDEMKENERRGNDSDDDGELHSSAALPVLFPASGPRYFYSTACVSQNCRDLAVGHVKGNIRIYDNLLPLVEQYEVDLARCGLRHGTAKLKKRSKAKMDFEGLSGRPKHPSAAAIIRNLHWHALQVASMAYDTSIGRGDHSLLFSGGEESVLISWQLGRGSHKPSGTLPRISVGGIVHICIGAAPAAGDNKLERSSLQSGGGVLVYTADNTLQLFEWRNQTLLWKVQGLAAASGATPAMTKSRSAMAMSHYTEQGGERKHAKMTLSGLPYAPGKIHWYDLSQQEVISSLEVVPFNRVSRTEREQSAMPSPTITHCLWSKSCDTAVTVDVVPTENTSMGKYQKFSRVGLVTTIRFWERGNDNHFDLVAAVAYPHGPKNRVSSVCLSEDGSFVCSASNDENAFRLWRREAGNVENKRAVKRVGWSCDFKVPTPSGYAKFPVGTNATAFSADSSILAVAYGDAITLWDCHELTLVTAIRHGNAKSSRVEQLKFISSARMVDMLFTVSKAAVTLQSPFGRRGPANLGWTYILPQGKANLRISWADYVVAFDFVVVAIFNWETDESSIVIIDPISGKSDILKNGSIPGKVVSVVPASLPENGRSTGLFDGSHDLSDIRLCVLTNRGEMILLDTQCHGVDLQQVSNHGVEPINEGIPAVPMLATSHEKFHQDTWNIVPFSEFCASSKIQHTLLETAFGSPGDLNSIFTTIQFPRIDFKVANALLCRDLERK